MMKTTEKIEKAVYKEQNQRAKTTEQTSSI